MLVNYSNGDIPTPSLLFVKADWCGHCQKAMPVLRQVGDMLGAAVPTLAIDSDANKAMVARLGVKSFPTIMYVDDGGQPHVFEGERTVHTIVGFVCSHASKTRGNLDGVC